MGEKRYIHIRNWDGFQHPDVTRNRKTAVPWIKDATAQLTDEDYLGLTFAERGILQGLRLQYATNRGRGIDRSTTNLLRLFAQRVTNVQIERLNHAGFIEISASKDASNTQADLRKKGRLDVEEDVDREEEQENPNPTPPIASNATKNGSGGDENEERVEPPFDLEHAFQNTLKDMPAAEELAY